MDSEQSATAALLAEHGMNDGSIARLFAHQTAAASVGFLYPWSDLETRLSTAGVETIYLVGYGSLLNPQSAARSIRGTPAAGHPPVVALGARRMFNYRMPEIYFERYGVQPGLLDRAALNAEPARDTVINGRLIAFALSDLPELRIRETAYDLHPVACLHWNSSDAIPFTAYVLCCPYESWEEKFYRDDTLMPYQPYYELCRSGAAQVSDQFLSLYLKTTFLADRRTTAFEVESASRLNN